MHRFDYDYLRNLLIEAMEDAGLFVKADEVLYLSELTRSFELFIQRSVNGEGTWAKVGFEWRADNQTAAFSAQETSHFAAGDLAAPSPERYVTVHAAFHLHFDGLSIGPDVISEVSEAIQMHAQHIFDGHGSVVAEVRLLPTEARLECLRYEVMLDSPIDADLAWWQNWGDLCAAMLERFDEIHAELYSRFGPAA